MALAYPLTLVLPNAAHTEEEILHHWNVGSKFKIYQGQYCTIGDTLKLKMAGVESVKLVYMGNDEKPHMKEVKL